MRYELIFTDKAEKQFSKMDKYAQTQINNYLGKHFGFAASNPRSHGKPLTGRLKGFWRYEAGKYRIICDIRDNVCMVVVIKIGHRKEIYR
ncbi:MAG: type II toxin-antitoxin system RelE/ParE family toxin [Defluviitaleaceae bacterium]|nr:type II toxin-antitoxin system RelE/ParE family toxin [Defluviitaleaceae bacterium]MCL2263098.1 type II toxin-antitoxin system RelE/ParE family toxin [Defluviitaleaceae bacterium]